MSSDSKYTCIEYQGRYAYRCNARKRTHLHGRDTKIMLYTSTQTIPICFYKSDVYT